jgi:hypothetical protein
VTKKQPGNWLSASGLWQGQPVTLLWTGRWTASDPAVLSLFLSFMLHQGWGDGTAGTEMFLPLHLGDFVPACRRAAEETFDDGDVVLDYDWEELPPGQLRDPRRRVGRYVTGDDARRTCGCDR